VTSTAAERAHLNIAGASPVFTMVSARPLAEGLHLVRTTSCEVSHHHGKFVQLSFDFFMQEDQLVHLSRDPVYTNDGFDAELKLDGVKGDVSRGSA
jgi:hypothetical protein